MADGLAALLATPPQQTTPPPAAPAPAPAAQQPPVEAPPRPGELPKRRYQTQSPEENQAITLAMESGKPLAEALAEVYQAAGKPLPAPFGFTAQPPPAAQPPQTTPAGTPQAPTPANPQSAITTPQSVAPVQQAQAEVDALRQQQLEIDKALLQVQTTTFDTVEGERLLAERHALASKLDAAQAGLILARQTAIAAEQQQAAQQINAYNTQYDAGFAEIAPAFPGLNQADSPLRQAFETELQRAWEANDPALLNPQDAPLIIARRAARAIGSPVSVPPVNTPVSSPQPSAPRPPVSFPGILPAGNGTSTAPPASTEASLAEMRASLHAARQILSGGATRNVGLEEYAN